MKANELRLGNYVNHNIENKAYKVETLSVAPNGDVLVLHGYFPHCTLDFVSPIPLTEEWLVKFGFKGIGLPLYLSTGYFEFVWRKELFLDIEGQWMSVKCEYVHQLQNLYFALTGEELVCE